MQHHLPLTSMEPNSNKLSESKGGTPLPEPSEENPDNLRKTYEPEHHPNSVSGDPQDNIECNNYARMREDSFFE